MTGDDQAPAEIDLTRIATTAADWMEYLEAEIRAEMGDGGGVPTVESVAIVVELNWPPDEKNEHCGSTAIRYRCTDGRRWFQKGLFTEVADAIGRSQKPELD